MAFVSCVDDQVQYGICLRYLDALEVPPRGTPVEKIAVLGAASMAEGYQRVTEASQGTIHPRDSGPRRGIMPPMAHRRRLPLLSCWTHGT